MWSCQREGSCCTLPDEVVLTHAERAEIERAAPSGVALSFRPHADARFVRLVAGPCPLYNGSGCSVYAVRPMNCRRYGCFRDDLTEPAELVPVPVKALATRENRRRFLMMERKAQKWGRAHGWSE